MDQQSVGLHRSLGVLYRREIKRYPSKLDFKLNNHNRPAREDSEQSELSEHDFDNFGSSRQQSESYTA